MYRFYNPVRTYLGNGCFGNIKEIIAEAVGTPKNIVLLVWSESVLEMEIVQNFLKEDAYAVKPIIFTNANPTVENLFTLYTEAKAVTYDLVVAIGGGSVLDAAKTLACLQNMEIQSEEDVRNIINEKTYASPKCKWIGVPTTSGTGSEVTCWATIWDMKKGKKLSVERQDNYAAAAVVDATFTASMPMSLAVSSALDAVAHATESYWANARNPVTKALALYAIKAIMESIDDLITNYGNTKAGDVMAMGSMIAGLAFSNTRTTACHSISYPLTMHYGVPHGVAVSMLVAPMIVCNDAYLEDKEDLLDAFGVKCVEEIQEKMDAIHKKAGIKSRLCDWNVAKEDIDFLVKNAFTKGRIDNNPRVLCEADVRTILQNIY
ncbi:phosphonoacetaldehyde reductase [Chakrabartyella piscis]|uniref:phosphonoacetaldehyde reductase n=1 Tax=Chakrabartyella piscis TaxID=2918914 RepID=UPI002958DD21|nr:phosphonoacetaldehyde reductase [Chakrabartyella piscis]